MKKLLHITVILLILSFVYAPIINVDALNISASASQSFFSKHKINTNNGFSDSFLKISQISNNDINIQENEGLDYVKELVDVWSKVSFTDEDFKSLKKDKNGRPFTVDELSRQAEIMGMTDDIYNSLKIWSELNNNVSGELRSMPVNKKQVSVHKSMISWYKYYSDFANKLANKNFSRDEIKKINSDFLKNSKYQLPSLHRKLAGMEGDSNNQFVLWKYVIKNAQAIGGAPQFGGLITSYSEFCITGFSFVVLGVQGGWMWIYYATMAIITPASGARANYIIHPGAYIKGRSIFGPGICTRILVDAHPSGVATVYLYGTSL